MHASTEQLDSMGCAVAIPHSPQIAPERIVDAYFWTSGWPVAQAARAKSSVAEAEMGLTGRHSLR